MPITIKDLTDAFTKNLEEIIIQEMINSNESLNLEDFVRDNIPDIVKLNEEIFKTDFGQRKAQALVNLLNDLETNGKYLYAVSSSEIENVIFSTLEDDYCAYFNIFDPNIGDVKKYYSGANIEFILREPPTAHNMLKEFVYCQPSPKNFYFDKQALFLSDEYGKFLNEIIKISEDLNELPPLIIDNEEQKYNINIAKFFLQEKKYNIVQAMNALDFLGEWFSYTVNVHSGYKTDLKNTKIVKEILNKVEDVLFNKDNQEEVKNNIPYLLYVMERHSLFMFSNMEDLSKKIANHYHDEIYKELNRLEKYVEKDILIYHYVMNKEVEKNGLAAYDFGVGEFEDKLIVSLENELMSFCYEYFRKTGDCVGKISLNMFASNEDLKVNLTERPYSILFNKEYFKDITSEKAIDLVIDSICDYQLMKKKDMSNNEKNNLILSLIQNKYRENYLLENMKLSKERVNKKNKI